MFEDFIQYNLSMKYIRFLIRIIVAILCGACIGYERSKRQKEAGLRTHIILAMGSAIFVIVSKYGFQDLVGTGVNIDGARVASNIVTGIGFLGAGVIFVRSGSVHGLTTAAGIWTTAAIGMCIGAGLYVIGIASMGMLILIQFILHRYVPSSESYENAEMYLRVKTSPTSLDDIKAMFLREHIVINNVRIKKGIEETEFKFTVRIYKEYSLANMIEFLNNDENVIEVNTAL